MKRLRRVSGILVELLREIFDEAAYARFLGRRVVVAPCYAAYLREREPTHARKPPAVKRDLSDPALGIAGCDTSWWATKVNSC